MHLKGFFHPILLLEMRLWASENKREYHTIDAWNNNKKSEGIVREFGVKGDKEGIIVANNLFRCVDV